MSKLKLNKPTMFSGRNKRKISNKRYKQSLNSLNLNDRREYRKFKKFLILRQKYGLDVLIQRPYWRKYLGLE